jgi:hypothetical protein
MGKVKDNRKWIDISTSIDESIWGQMTAQGLAGLEVFDDGASSRSIDGVLRFPLLCCILRLAHMLSFVFSLFLSHCRCA